MKKRQLKKVFKIAARQINSGDFTKLKPVYFGTINKAIHCFWISRYDAEFRPWWYSDEIMNRCYKLDLKTEIHKYYKKCYIDFEVWSGINMDLYKQYFEINHTKSEYQEDKCECCCNEKEECLCGKILCKRCGEVITFRNGYQYCYGCEYSDDPHYWDW